MVGLSPVPAWLETDWLLGQFSGERFQVQAGYAAFVGQGVGQSSVWEGLRHQVFLGSEAFVERHCGPVEHLARLREVPRAQRRPLANPLTNFARRYPVRHEAMARAFQTGVYTMKEIADYFGVHYSTVGRAVLRLEHENGSTEDLGATSENA